MNIANNNSGMIENKKRIFYFDALRALAIIAVIIIHICTRTKGFVVGGYPHFTFSWFMADVMANCFWMAIGLFLMLTGALSLGRVWDIKSFLGKRIPRIVYPFVFWGFILSIFLILSSYLFPNIVHIVKCFDFNTLVNFTINAYLHNANSFKPYWYFWMILGVYLIIPIFNKWLLHSDLKEAEYFLFFWIITSIFDFTLFQSFPVELSYFTSPIGFVVLGYYLRHTKRKIFDNLYVPIVLIIVGSVATIYVSYIFSSSKIFYLVNQYSIFMVLEAAGIFLLFKNLSKLNLNIKSNGIVRRGVFSLAKYSYGIYLMHTPILTVIMLFLKYYTNLNFKPMVLVSFVSIVFVCWTIMALLNRVPYLNKIIGAE